MEVLASISLGGRKLNFEDIIGHLENLTGNVLFEELISISYNGDELKFDNVDFDRLKKELDSYKSKFVVTAQFKTGARSSISQIGMGVY